MIRSNKSLDFLETILIILGHSMIFEFNEFMSIKRDDDPALSLIQDLTYQQNYNQVEELIGLEDMPCLAVKQA